MTRDYLPPLLRGVGTTLILIGAVVAFVSARRDLNPHTYKVRAPALTPSGYAPQLSPGTVPEAKQPLVSERRDPNLAEEVVENLWFESLGIIGAGMASASFYLEAAMRRSKGFRIEGSSREG